MKISVEKTLNRKVLFIALDSATNWIVEDLLAKGELPNLTSLIRTGAYYRMESGDLVMSPVIWTSIASGKLPDKHGVKSFFATAETVKTKRMWDIFEGFGRSVGIVGYFLTWPPRKVNGFMIPMLLAIDERTYPPEYGFLHKMTVEKKSKQSLGIPQLIKLGLTAFKYGVRMSNLLTAGFETVRGKIVKQDYRDEIYKARVLKQKIYSDVFIALNKKVKPGLAAFHNHLVDTTSHDFWRYLQPEKFNDVPQEDIEKYGDRIYDAYRETDKTLGKILKLRKEGSETLVIVASDHGAKSMVESPEIGHTPMINSEKLMIALGIEQDISYSTVSYFVIVKPRVESEEARDRLKELFLSIEVQESGTPLFTIHKYDDDNIWLRVNQKIQSIENIHIHLGEKNYPVNEFVRTAGIKVSGTHDGRSAILVLNGDGVKQGYKSSTHAEAIDVVPTLLTLMNMPVAKDMDGSVLKDAIDEDFLEKHPVKYIDSYDEPDYGSDASADMEVSQELKDQLKALGYL